MTFIRNEAWFVERMNEMLKKIAMLETDVAQLIRERDAAIDRSLDDVLRSISRDGL